ncbi:hypothetical protein BJX63DRAFT_118467 [Aspergillus granulosus]|uniref:Zn(2)-C6 fungal-type domain-containing protein n=1 Tax=Aspergillus granulosus TaxID=176169 RepID=A0ABR4GTT2_9EURO
MPDRNPDSTSPANQRPRSKRAPSACEYCHQRKTRCDLVHVSPCTNCRLDKIPCIRRPPRKPSSAIGRPRARLTTKNIDNSTHSALGLVLTAESNVNFSPEEFPPPNMNRLPFSYYAFLDGTPLGRLHENDIALLESRGCLHLPSRPVTDSLLVHYFLYIHPSLPMLDEKGFWRLYRQPDQCIGQFSLNLFQAMLFAAVPFAPEYVAKECGFDSLLAAREAFYSRAELLHNHLPDHDNVVNAQIALLLSFYNSSKNSMNNSNWLSIAVGHAEAEDAHQYEALILLPEKRRKMLKRLWWCCILRDRVISMGMRRPLQIPSTRFRISGESLCLADLQDEIDSSAVYPADIKLALVWLLIRLCHFADAVTELLSIVYPPLPDYDGAQAEAVESDWARLRCARSKLAVWDMDFARLGEEEVAHNHPSITLFTRLTSVYYQTARIALCNHACQQAARFEWCHTTLSLEYYKRELQEAFGAMTEQVRHLVAANMAKYLPVSAMAYTVLPLILWGINVSLSSTPTARHHSSQGLSLFTEVNRSYSLRYDVKRLALLVDRALHFAKLELIKLRPSFARTGQEISFLDLFEQEPASYVALCLFLDSLLSCDNSPKQARDPRVDASSKVVQQPPGQSCANSSSPSSLATNEVARGGLDLVIADSSDQCVLAQSPTVNPTLEVQDLRDIYTPVGDLGELVYTPAISADLVSEEFHKSRQEPVQGGQILDFWGMFGE